jgi:hypothetical protein
METMSNGDVLSVVLSGVAVAAAAAVAMLMYGSPQHRSRFGRRSISATLPVVVRLVPSAGTGLGYWWRLQTAGDAPTTSVDILSYRSHGADETIPWQHELLDGPLALEPAQPAHLRAPALVTAESVYDVTVGWTIHRPDADSEGSVLVTVTPEPYDAPR